MPSYSFHEFFFKKEKSFFSRNHEASQGIVVETTTKRAEACRVPWGKARPEGWSSPLNCPVCIISCAPPAIALKRTPVLSAFLALLTGCWYGCTGSLLPGICGCPSYSLVAGKRSCNPAVGYRSGAAGVAASQRRPCGAGSQFGTTACLQIAHLL